MYDEPVLLEPLAPAGEPTDALPGSEVKIRIMIERAARGEPLFHPQDGLKKAGRAPAGPSRQLPWWPTQPAPTPSEVAAPPEPLEDDLADELDEAAAEAVLPLIDYAGQANSA